MTLSSAIALFGAMVILALVPSISVLAVSTRSATFGFLQGAFTTLGVVCGDIVFILIAIWGLSFLAEKMGNLFFLIRYLGGAYLILLGIGLYRSKPEKVETQIIGKSSWLASFLTGLSITLADQKATLFYLGFFPAFLDLSQITPLDTAIVIAIAATAVGGVKLSYAFMANKARVLMSANIRKGLNQAAGCITLAVGVFLLVKS
ncbi:LysE family translocator [Kamptonema cortianum]|uniref:LysE family translocator n=1 Tax=Geitlerinema calcuttense NRMC-F 0142 TaxID=2922238 RepID=A0ABT7M1C2_9CYAN|nr:LysE family translocator [Geitlerinema calcuttense]MDK3159263.1 LysE family translocator [Kamptonema cortianum]MDL5056851.1 LysE family translocator [Geitlerinema calcuttense NRMC-F 0142]